MASSHVKRQGRRGKLTTTPMESLRKKKEPGLRKREEEKSGYREKEVAEEMYKGGRWWKIRKEGINDACRGKGGWKKKRERGE